MGGRSRWRGVAVIACGLAVMFAAPPVATAADGPAITYVGVSYDQTDFRRLRIGNAGYWFPQFDALAPVSRRPTDERALDARPPGSPLNHWDEVTTRPVDGSAC